MSGDPPAVPRLTSINRQQLILRSMDVEQLVDEDHCVRAIWELTGRLNLRRYHEHIAAIEGIAGREHTDPRLLISLWLYAYSRGIYSARSGVSLSNPVRSTAPLRRSLATAPRSPFSEP